MLALSSRERLKSLLRYMFDENEFLSPYGIRSMSKYHQAHPYVFHCGNAEHRVDYLPGESNTGLFGGNSNWRGPIWIQINYLFVEALEKYYHFYGDELENRMPNKLGKMGESTKPLRIIESPASSFQMQMECVPVMERSPSGPILTGAICCCFTSISMARPAKV